MLKKSGNKELLRFAAFGLAKEYGRAGQVKNEDARAAFNEAEKIARSQIDEADPKASERTMSIWNGDVRGK